MTKRDEQENKGNSNGAKQQNMGYKIVHTGGKSNPIPSFAPENQTCDVFSCLLYHLVTQPLRNM